MRHRPKVQSHLVRGSYPSLLVIEGLLSAERLGEGSYICGIARRFSHTYVGDLSHPRAYMSVA